MYINKIVCLSFAHHSLRASIVDWTARAGWYDDPYQPIGECFWILPLMVIFTNIINLYDNILIDKYQGLSICNMLTPLHETLNVIAMWDPAVPVSNIAATDDIGFVCSSCVLPKWMTSSTSWFFCFSVLPVPATELLTAVPYYCEGSGGSGADLSKSEKVLSLGTVEIAMVPSTSDPAWHNKREPNAVCTRR